jgi:ferric-dicitrate binding protein FerR (iron transport regulator)
MINTQEALNKVLERITKEIPKRTFWYFWQKIASIFILPLAIGSLLWIFLNTSKTSSNGDPVFNEVYAAFGTRSSLKLADGTLVWLNSGSSLKYPDKFNNKSRQVYLKGEAYFEVKSDISKPFIVGTSTLDVKVTGTKFDVQAYESNPVAGVTLVSGKVYVYEPNNNTNNSKLISELNPNQHLDYNTNTKTKNIVNEDAYLFIAWKDGKLIFRNAPLSEVIEKISLAFNVDIEIQDNAIKDFRYRATFQDESLEEILKLLKYNTPIDFKEIKRNPLPDGSFPKKKVIIFQTK